MSHPQIPSLIEVVRGRNGLTGLFIDGTEFPYAISARDAISVDVQRDEPGGVRFTLLGRRVHVRDDLLAEVPDFPHEDDGEPERAPARPREVVPCEKDIVDGPSGSHEVCTTCAEPWPCLAEEQRREDLEQSLRTG